MKPPQGTATRWAKIERASASDRAESTSLRQPFLVNGFLYASDRFILARVPVADTEADHAGPVPIRALKAARQARVGLVLSPETATVATESESLSVQRVKADFPYQVADEIIQRTFAPTTIRLNARFLCRLAEALGSDQIEISLDSEDPLKPLIVRPLAMLADDRVGAIMPIRPAGTAL